MAEKETRTINIDSLLIELGKIVKENYVDDSPSHEYSYEQALTASQLIGCINRSLLV